VPQDTWLASTRSAAAVWLVPDSPESRRRLMRRSWRISGPGEAACPPERREEEP
jgi:hypothetical protein